LKTYKVRAVPDVYFRKVRRVIIIQSRVLQILLRQ
jgi:hypothetical protein